MITIKDYNLYAVISEEYCLGRSALEIAERAIEGGCDIIQMREKHKTSVELAALGARLSALCRKAGKLFIVNDDPELAKLVDADGVHIGQEDAARLSIETVRGIIGRDRMIGISTHSPDQFKKANAADVDYIAFGPIFPTKTKKYSIGTSAIKEVMDQAKSPVIFIGGINISNIDEVLELGAKNIALIRGITESGDITASARALKDRLNRNVGQV